jgi:hypothetical protein
MRAYLFYLKKRWLWAVKGVGGIASLVSFIVGAVLAALVWLAPNWSKNHITQNVNIIILGFVPFIAGASLFLFRWLWSPYAAYHDLKRQYDDMTDVRKEERRKAVRECSEKAALSLKQPRDSPEPMMSFHAFVLAGGCDLESNEEIIEASNFVKESGYDHPFDGISPGHVPEKDLLEFMRHIKFAPNINPARGVDYLEAANQWRIDHGYPLPTADERIQRLFNKVFSK